MLAPFLLVTGQGVDIAAGVILLASLLVTLVWLRVFFR